MMSGGTVPAAHCSYNELNMKNNNKKRRRSYKYHAVSFKLSQGQYKSLINYCKARKTTPIKLIKRNIERFISHYEYGVPESLFLCENQLDLFDDQNVN